jgi:cytochrome c peroxidase
MNNSKRVLATTSLLLIAAGLVAGRDIAAAAPDNWTDAEIAVLQTLSIRTLQERPTDPSNAYEGSPAAAALGKRIFFDPRFSANQQVSCASCHDPRRQFQDGRPLGHGISTGIRRTMPIVGSANSPWQFWDGRKDSVWSQALGPLEDPREHGGNRVAYARLIDKYYRRDYEAVFHSLPDLTDLPDEASPVGTTVQQEAWSKMSDEQREGVSRIFANMGKAIAAYEKTLKLTPSRMDNYIEHLAQQDSAATQSLSPSEKRGLRLFIGKGACVTCHAGPLLSDQHFHNTGVPPRDGFAPDMGRAAAIKIVLNDEFNCLGKFSDAHRRDCAELEFIAATDPHMLGAFKTPSLRNVGQRPPYMHAGQIRTLEDVVRHYANAPASAIGHNERQPVVFSAGEMADLVAFMGTLNSETQESREFERRFEEKDRNPDHWIISADTVPN